MTRPRGSFLRSVLLAALGLGGLVVLLALGLFVWADADALIPILRVAALPICLFVLVAYLVRARLVPRRDDGHRERAI